jgi:hypothetical protein
MQQVAGRRTVPVELGQHYLQEGWGTSLMTLDDFIAQHMVAKPAAAAAAAGGASPAVPAAAATAGKAASELCKRTFVC